MMKKINTDAANWHQKENKMPTEKSMTAFSYKSGRNWPISADFVYFCPALKREFIQNNFQLLNIKKKFGELRLSKT